MCFLNFPSNRLKTNSHKKLQVKTEVNKKTAAAVVFCVNLWDVTDPPVTMLEVCGNHLPFSFGSKPSLEVEKVPNLKMYSLWKMEHIPSNDQGMNLSLMIFRCSLLAAYELVPGVQYSKKEKEIKETHPTF